MQHRMRGIGAGILAAILTMALAFGNGTVPAIADENAPAPSTHNAIVLVLDNSGSMSGEPIERLKTATKQFVDKVLAKDPEGKIALVAFSDDTNVQDFTSDKNALDSFADNNLWGDSGTDVTAGLKKADELYSGLKDTDTVRYKRSIVTMSDGWPNDADSATAQAKSMFPKYSMYSVGFYPYQDNSAAEFMKSIQNAGYYEADNLDALIDVFTKIVDIILNPLDISLLTTATYLPAEDNISYSVTATIANTNNATVTGVKAALTPNDNINFTGTSERNVGDIKPQERKTLTWEGLTQKNHNDTSGTYSVIVSGTNVATISKTARITFNDSTTQDNKIVFGKDNWSFKNFGDWKLSRTDREALLDNASLFTNRNANRAELEDFIDELDQRNASWGFGNCYGLATTTILAKMGVDNPYNRNSPTAADLYHTQKNNQVISYINYYHIGQRLLKARDEQDKFNKLNIRQKLSYLKQETSRVARGSTPVLISLQGSDSGHTILGDAYSDLSPYESFRTGNKYNGKVHIIDNEFPNESNYYIFINTNNGEWAYVESNFANVNESPRNGSQGDTLNKISNVQSDLSVIGMLDNNVNVANVDARLSAGTNTDKARAAISNGADLWSVQDILQGKASGLSYYYDSDGEGSGTSLNVTLPSRDQNYTVSSPATYDYRLSYGDAYTSVQSPKAKSAAFSPDGTVALTGNEGQYILGSAVDANPMPWYHVKVSGKAAKDVKLVKDADGYIVEGDNLTDAKVSANNTSETKTVKLNTKADKVQMRADGNKLVAAIDKDHNGSYETVIADSANQDNHGTPSAPQGSNGKPQAGGSKPLSDTGSAVTAFAITGGALLLAGVTVILIARRRRD